MIEFRKANFFNEINNFEAIINTVNCVGVMGKGIALEFKKRYPENFIAYKKACQSKELIIGKSLVFPLMDDLNTKFIINFPTKLHWRNPSKIEYIEQGLDDLVEIIREKKIKSILMPALGCGNGNLDWDIVKPLIKKKLEHLNDIRVTVIEPTPTVNTKLKKPRLTTTRKKLLLLMNDYNKSSTSSLITYKEVNLLSYLLTYVDPKLNLDFSLSSVGPYCKDINSILLSLNGYYISPQKNNTSKNSTPIKVNTINFPKKTEVLQDKDYLEVKELIKGFESPTELMLLCVVHWFKFNEGVSEENLLNKVHDWLKCSSDLNVEDKLINKAINRIIKISIHTTNLKLDL
ncbi:MULTISPECIES: type II toxin-antitoxin system antitoxin DNA ADP-ribosyl glycohydrolase DarG [Lysinibacillus]|jgi:O-acetyl-ADP-ribose deacetylase (regulator of RNase III)|uniref:type II toxin-antitoxin system antitoxin DNA ADP-ribosyl glycohydrolase DarG n=1 Tax=Lysinibacillus TaxID=400634 RepID=UPI000693E43B|nr:MULTISPECIES: macro domain-containing protein [Lysinibacillus]